MAKTKNEVRMRYSDVLRILGAVLCAASGVLLILGWGLGAKFWTIVGILLIGVAFASAYFLVQRDYITGATPAAVAGIFTLFLKMPPDLIVAAAVILLFAGSAMGYVLYEVD